MIIREFQQEDIEKGLLETYQEVWKIDEISEITLHNFLATDNYMVVAEDEGEIIGTATLHFQRKLIRNGGIAAFIEDVAVREKYRGQGIGAKLVEHLVEEARKSGCYKVNLSCFPERVAFYERCGLKQESITMRYYL
jgi:glucosamine-phosphate N-acetyltransferase